MDLPAEHYKFSTLAANASTVSYRELSALLHALPTHDDEARKKHLLHYAIHTRHRLTRLLVATRWLREHGALAARAVLAEDSADSRTQIYEDVAHALWDTHNTVRENVEPRPAVASAVDILMSGSLTGLPRVLGSAIPPKPDELPRPEKKHVLTSEVSEVTQEGSASPYALLYQGKPYLQPLGVVSPTVTERLGIATRNCIRESVLHLGSLQILSWRSGIADVCVRVGIPNLWSADVSLDSLDPESAVLRAHAISVKIANDIDAAGQYEASKLESYASNNGDGTTSATTSAQDAVLRRVADDRMSAALHAAKAIAKGQTSFNPTAVMLCALRDMMMDDVCAPLAMDFLRAQAVALSNGRWKGFLKVEGASSDTSRSVPLTIQYWLDHREPAAIRISEYRIVGPDPGTGASPMRSEENDTLESITDATLERKPGCINCTHEPPLPSAVELGGMYSPLELRMHELNVEALLLESIRVRSRARLKHLAELFINRRSTLRLHPSCIELSKSRTTDGVERRLRATGAEEVLRIHLGGNDKAGLEFCVFTMTGGMRVRPYGAAALPLPVQRFNDSCVWTGAKHLGSSSEELEAAVAAFEAVRARVKLNAAARSVCALDIGVSNTLPPGTASVAATASPDRAASQLVPPFAPLERRAPRRFLTLSPPPPAKHMLSNLSANAHTFSRTRMSGSRGLERNGSAKRPRLTYATTSDALVFIQESSFAGEDWQVGARIRDGRNQTGPSKTQSLAETDAVDRYGGTAAAAAAWAVTRDVVERRLRRDSLLRAFVAANVASAAQMHQSKSSEDGDLHLESASRVLLKVKCEPLPVRRAELLLRGYDAWQVRLSLLPRIFDSTDPTMPSDQSELAKENSRGDGNLWSVGVACTGSQLTFTYPSANAASVRSFFRDLTRARTAAALARGVPPSPFYRVLRRSPVRIVVGIGPFGKTRTLSGTNGKQQAQDLQKAKPMYTATVEYVYSKGNSGGFSLSFSPSKQTMEQLAPLIEEALDASGGQVGGILAGLLERACPVAAAAESAVIERGSGKIRFVTALRVRAVFAGVQKTVVKEGVAGQQGQAQSKQQGQSHVVHAVDVDARGGSGLVTVIDVGRATAVMIQQGFANRSGPSSGSNSHRRNDFMPLPKWDETVAALTRDGYAEAQRAGSTVVLKMEVLEQFLSDLVTSAGSTDAT